MLLLNLIERTAMMSASLNPSEPEPPSKPIPTISGPVPSPEDAKAKVIKITQALSLVNNTDVRTQQGALGPLRVHVVELEKLYHQAMAELKETAQYREVVPAKEGEGAALRQPILSQLWAILTMVIGLAGLGSMSIVAGSWMLRSGILVSAGNSLPMACAQTFGVITVTFALANVQEIHRSDERRRMFHSRMRRLAVVLLTIFGMTLAAYAGLHQIESGAEGDVPDYFVYVKAALVSLLLLIQVAMEVAASVAIKASVIAAHARKHHVAFEPNPVYLSRQQDVQRRFDDWMNVTVQIAELETKSKDHDLACFEDERAAESALKKAQQKRIAAIAPPETDQANNVTPLRRKKS